jgi:tetratricopeptide (TPR) repeat protein
MASICCHETGAKQKAYKYIDIAVARGDEPAAYVQKGYFLEQDEHYIDALKYYRQAAEMTPDDEFVQDKISEILDLCKPPTDY